MTKAIWKSLLVIGFMIMLIAQVNAQLSPGDLTSVHAHLEGLSNCTKCHSLGNKVPNQKCLDCHLEIKERITSQKGYHTSSATRNKSCVECHNDHHGRKFEIVRFDLSSFDHSLTGYKLESAHSKKECKDCHKNEYIKDQEIRDKRFTYLGLSPDCLNCHEDIHQNTLSKGCAECHSFEKFKPAPFFNHEKTDYKLEGKHKNIECLECHKKVIRQGREFQQFAQTEFTNCTSCHKDVHKNKFGQQCVDCHTVNSFTYITNPKNFNHNQTRYKLIGKHKSLDCKSCHKNKLTDPLAFNKCFNCHEDYHRRQFSQNEIISNCSDCHSNNSFKHTSYDLSKHNKSQFPLEGPHMATPCFLCHKKNTDRWEFRNIGLKCIDCHENVHKANINSIYYPDSNCKVCHKVSLWKNVNFDHNRTNFKLEGKHAKVSCYDCHYKTIDKIKIKQQFSNLKTDCANCHIDIHNQQFDKNGLSECIRCHSYNNWEASRFDHNTAAFKLDGKHKNLKCIKCHKKESLRNTNYINYKLNQFRCEDCH